MKVNSITRKDDDGRDEGVFGIVHFHGRHLFTESEEGFGVITHSGNVVRISRVGQIVGEDDRIGIGVVSPCAAQHHHFTRTRLEQRNLILPEQRVESGQPLRELDSQLDGENRHFGYVLKLGLALRLVHSRRGNLSQILLRRLVEFLLKVDESVDELLLFGTQRFHLNCAHGRAH